MSKLSHVDVIDAPCCEDCCIKLCFCVWVFNIFYRYWLLLTSIDSFCRISELWRWEVFQESRSWRIWRQCKGHWHSSGRLQVLSALRASRITGTFSCLTHLFLSCVYNGLKFSLFCRLDVCCFSYLWRHRPKPVWSWFFNVFEFHISLERVKCLL